MTMPGKQIGYAKFVCPMCGHAVAAAWRKRTKLYEGRCIHCQRWNKYRKAGEPAMPSMD